MCVQSYMFNFEMQRILGNILFFERKSISSDGNCNNIYTDYFQTF